MTLQGVGAPSDVVPAQGQIATALATLLPGVVAKDVQMSITLGPVAAPLGGGQKQQAMLFRRRRLHSAAAAPAPPSASAGGGSPRRASFTPATGGRRRSTAAIWTMRTSRAWTDS